MLSIIIPTYNEEKTLEKTILQFKNNLNVFPHEIIVTDDISTDNTLAIAKKFADKVVTTQTKSTIAANRNRGAKEALYPYLVFVDSGVEIPDINKFFKTALENFSANKNLLGLTVNVRISKNVRTKTDAFFSTIVDTWYRIANNFLGQGIATGKFQMFIKDTFIHTGGYNENLAAGEDTELFNRLSKIGRTLFENRLTVYHIGRREHAVGWLKLMSIWATNAITATYFKRSASKEWKAIR